MHSFRVTVVLLQAIYNSISTIEISYGFYICLTKPLLSELSCENCTAVGEEPKGHYLQKDIGGIGTHLKWVVLVRILDFGILKGFMRPKYNS